MEFFYILFNIITDLPIEVIVVLFLIILIPALIATLLSFSFGKKKDKNKKETDDKVIDKKKFNESSKQNTIQLDENVEKVEPIISNEELLIEQNLIPKINLDEILKENIYRNVKTNDSHFIDILVINQHGVFLIFNEDKLRGKISGNNEDEYLLRKKENILNPIFIKDRYKDKVNEWLQIDRNEIKILCISKKIKKMNEDLAIFKNEKEAFEFIYNTNESYTIDKVFYLNERVIFLDKRR